MAEMEPQHSRPRSLPIRQRTIAPAEDQAERARTQAMEGRRRYTLIKQHLVYVSEVCSLSDHSFQEIMDTFYAYGMRLLQRHAFYTGRIGGHLLRIVDVFGLALLQRAETHIFDPMSEWLDVGLAQPIRLKDVLVFEPEATAMTAMNSWPTSRTLDIVCALATIDEERPIDRAHYIATHAEIHDFAPQLWGSEAPPEDKNPVEQRLMEYWQRAFFERGAINPEKVYPAANMPSGARSLSILYHISSTHWVHLLLRVDVQYQRGEILLHDSDTADEVKVQARLARLNNEIPMLAHLISARKDLGWAGVVWPTQVSPAACAQLSDASDSGFFAAECARRCLLQLDLHAPITVNGQAQEGGMAIRLHAVKKLRGLVDAHVAPLLKSATGNHSARGQAEVPLRSATAFSETPSRDCGGDAYALQAAFDVGFEHGFEAAINSEDPKVLVEVEERASLSDVSQTPEDADEDVSLSDHDFMPLDCPFRSCNHVAEDWSSVQHHVDIVHGGRKLVKGADIRRDDLSYAVKPSPAHAGKPYRCSVADCGKGYKQAAGLEYHMENFHGNHVLGQNADGSLRVVSVIDVDLEKEFKCYMSDCGKVYTDLDGLLRHKRFEHFSKQPRKPGLLRRATIAGRMNVRT